VSPADITHKEFQKTSSTERPPFASKECLPQALRVQNRNVTVLYGVTSDLGGLRKVKLSLYRPGQAQGVSKRLRFPQYLENRNLKMARFSALCTGRLYPQEIPVVLNSDIGWVDPRVTELSQWKIPMNPTKIEHATLRLAAQRLIQLHNRVPPRRLRLSRKTWHLLSPPAAKIN
jgi:hypothetical protein